MKNIDKKPKTIKTSSSEKTIPVSSTNKTLQRPSAKSNASTPNTTANTTPNASKPSTPRGTTPRSITSEPVSKPYIYTMSDIEKHTLYYKSKLFIVSIDNVGNHEVHGTFFANCVETHILSDKPRNKDSIIGLTINCFGNRGANQDDILQKRAKVDNFTISKTNVPIFFIKSETENNKSNYLFKEKRNINENVWKYYKGNPHTDTLTITGKRIRIYKQTNPREDPNILLDMKPAQYKFSAEGSDDGVRLTIQRFDKEEPISFNKPISFN